MLKMEYFNLRLLLGVLCSKQVVYGRWSHVTSNVELRNNVRLLLNVRLRNYVISRQIVERRVTSDCYLNIVVSLDC